MSKILFKNKKINSLIEFEKLIKEYWDVDFNYGDYNYLIFGLQIKNGDFIDLFKKVDRGSILCYLDSFNYQNPKYLTLQFINSKKFETFKLRVYPESWIYE